MNAGSDDRNYQVRDLANAVARACLAPEVSINTSAPVDSRSYKVDFALFRSLAPDHQPVVTLDQSIKNLIAGLKAMNFKDSDFRSSGLMRLKVLQDHIESGSAQRQSAMEADLTVGVEIAPLDLGDST